MELPYKNGEKAVETIDSLTKLQVNFTKELEAKGQINRPTAKQIPSDFEQGDGFVIQEGAAVAKDRIRMKLGILLNSSNKNWAKVISLSS